MLGLHYLFKAFIIINVRPFFTLQFQLSIIPWIRIKRLPYQSHLKTHTTRLGRF